MKNAAAEAEDAMRNAGNEIEAEARQVGNDVENAAENAGDAMQNAANRTAAEMREFGREAQQEVNEAAREVKSDSKRMRVKISSKLPMKEVSMDMKEVPMTLQNIVKEDFQGWTVHKVKRVEQDGKYYTKFELKSEALDREVKPMYSATGQLVEIDD